MGKILCIEQPPLEDKLLGNDEPSFATAFLAFCEEYDKHGSDATIDQLLEAFTAFYHSKNETGPGLEKISLEDYVSHDTQLPVSCYLRLLHYEVSVMETTHEAASHLLWNEDAFSLIVADMEHLGESPGSLFGILGVYDLQTPLIIIGTSPEERLLEGRMNVEYIQKTHDQAFVNKLEDCLIKYVKEKEQSIPVYTPIPQEIPQNNFDWKKIIRYGSLALTIPLLFGLAAYYGVKGCQESSHPPPTEIHGR